MAETALPPAPGLMFHCFDPFLSNQRGGSHVV